MLYSDIILPQKKNDAVYHSVLQGVAQLTLFAVALTSMSVFSHNANFICSGYRGGKGDTGGGQRDT